MPKKDLPSAPFFLFDIDKVLNDPGATSSLLKDQFFSSQSKKDQPTSDGKSTLKELLTQKQLNPTLINEYLKTLSPSAIELEFLSLSNFDLASHTEST